MSDATEWIELFQEFNQAAKATRYGLDNPDAFGQWIDSKRREMQYAALLELFDNAPPTTYMLDHWTTEEVVRLFTKLGDVRVRYITARQILEYVREAEDANASEVADTDDFPF